MPTTPQRNNLTSPQKRTLLAMLAGDLLVVARPEMRTMVTRLTVGECRIQTGTFIVLLSRGYLALTHEDHLGKSYVLTSAGQAAAHSLQKEPRP